MHVLRPGRVQFLAKATATLGRTLSHVLDVCPALSATGTLDGHHRVVQRSRYCPAPVMVANL